MGINDYMTVSEAAYRWQISSYKLNRMLKDEKAVQELIDHKLLKKFQLEGSTRIYWIIHVKAMEMWYGPEAKQNDDRRVQYCCISNKTVNH